MRRNLGTQGDGGKIGWVGLLGCLVVLSPLEPREPLAPGSGAWSGDGHRIVCQLAWERLMPEAKSGVRRLLGPGLSAATFASECVWADEIRAQLSADPKGLNRFRPFTTAHYVNFTPRAETLSREGCTTSVGSMVRYCALDGITHLVETLEGGPSAISKAEALRFLIHIVGDLHQPLHAGYGHDRGGNDLVVNVVGLPDRNLHWVWDAFMVGQGGESWRSIGERLSRSIAPIQERMWREPSALAWAAESYAIVETQVYRGIEDGGYVGQTYYDRNVETAELRLKMAGVRLAGLLNRLFTDG